MKKYPGVLLSIVIGSGLVASAQPGFASCAGLPVPVSQAIASAPVVFVGTVVGTTDGDRTATVHVDELWRGPNLPAEVTVHGSPDVGCGNLR